MVIEESVGAKGLSREGRKPVSLFCLGGGFDGVEIFATVPVGTGPDFPGVAIWHLEKARPANEPPSLLAYGLARDEPSGNFVVYCFYDAARMRGEIYLVSDADLAAGRQAKSAHPMIRARHVSPWQVS